MPRSAATLLMAISALALVATFMLPPIAQDPAYHAFADQRTLLGIPHFADSVSNAGFILVGVLGLRALARTCPPGGLPELLPAYRLFFAGVLLVGLGSTYYHLDPTNATLLWDRLPMTITFMALFAAVVGEHLSTALGRHLLWPLAGAGIAAALYWHVTETAGRGDLRPYALVQLLPLLLIPLVLIRYRSPLSGTRYLWLMLGSYGLAKAAEATDAWLFITTGLISGHTLKHVLAAAGAYAFLTALRHRRASTPGDTG